MQPGVAGVSLLLLLWPAATAALRGARSRAVFPPRSKQKLRIAQREELTFWFSSCYIPGTWCLKSLLEAGDWRIMPHSSMCGNVKTVRVFV